MRRRILIFVLALGTVLGYGAFIARLATCHARGGPGYAGWGGWREERREMFERHVAELCADAALRNRPRESLAPNVVVVPGAAALPVAPAATPPAAP